MTLEVAGLGLVSESGLSSVWKNLKRAKMSLLLSALEDAMIFGILDFRVGFGDLFIHTCSSCNDAIDKLMKSNC